MLTLLVLDELYFFILYMLVLKHLFHVVSSCRLENTKLLEDSPLLIICLNLFEVKVSLKSMI